MENFRYGLGDQPRIGIHVSPLGLTLHELGELLRRAGRAAGFIVESEYKVHTDKGGHVKKIDWVWLSPKKGNDPIVAIEIEGPGLPLKSITNDISRFNACEAKLNVICLFQVDHNRTQKQRPPYGIKPKTYVANHIKSSPIKNNDDIEIFLDEELMKPGGIENFQKQAEELLSKKQRV